MIKDGSPLPRYGERRRLVLKAAARGGEKNAIGPFSGKHRFWSEFRSLPTSISRQWGEEGPPCCRDGGAEVGRARDSDRGLARRRELML